MEISTERLEKIYAQKSDQDLTDLVVNNGRGIRPDALPILEKEMQKRGMDSRLFSMLSAQNKTLSETELEVFAEQIRDLPCPVCGNQHERLNAAVISTVASFILFTSYKKRLLIACPSCLKSKSTVAIASTALIGWWGFPWGFIHTPVALTRNIQNLLIVKQAEPSKMLMAFTAENIGFLTIYKDNPQALQTFIHLK